MRKTIHQMVFTAALSLAASSSAQAQQNGTISDDIAAIIPVVMSQVNDFGQTQKDTQIIADAAIELASINDAEELIKRLQDIDAYIGAATDMIAILRAAPVLATFEARSKNLDDAQQLVVFDLMAESLEAAGATEIVRKMQGDRRYFRAWSDLLEILRDNPEMWSPEDSDNLPIRLKNKEFEAVFWAQIDSILLAEKAANQNAADVDAASPSEN